MKYTYARLKVYILFLILNGMAYTLVSQSSTLSEIQGQLKVTGSLTVDTLARINGRLELVKGLSNKSIIIGEEAGRRDDIFWTNNIYLGYRAGKNTRGTSNVYLGTDTGSGADQDSSSRNVLIGFGVAKQQSFGDLNTFVGYLSGRSNNLSKENTFVGANSGSNNTRGNANTYIGYFSGANSNGHYNTFVGTSAGFRNGAGNGNTAIGVSSASGPNATNSIFIGRFANFNGVKDSLNNAIAIGHNSVVNCSHCAVIGGVANQSVKLGLGVSIPKSGIHLKQKSNNTSGGLYLESQSGSKGWHTYVSNNDNLTFFFAPNNLGGFISPTSGSYSTFSDQRLKQDITPFDVSLESLLQLTPKSYQWKNSSNSGRAIGFIAQEVEKLFPELITENNGYLGVSYAEFSVLAIRGIQLLHKEIEELANQAQDNRQEIQQLKSLIKTLIKTDQKK